jgi:hypothetical protein
MTTNNSRVLRTQTIAPAILRRLTAAFIALPLAAALPTVAHAGAPPAPVPPAAPPAAPAAASPAAAAAPAAAAPAAAPATAAPGTGAPKATPTAGAAGSDSEAEVAHEAKPGRSTDSSDTSYVYVGARYRGNILPGFLLSPFIKESGSFYLNQVGAEIEFRTGKFSIIPSLTFSEYSTGGDKLMVEAGKDITLASNWSVINSSMKALNANVDFLWSKRLSRKVDFEYGFGLGFGVVFDSLKINWVYADPAGAYKSEGGATYSLCNKGDDTTGRRGCSKADHSNSKFSKVGGFEEPSWLSGGAKPAFLPNITLPHVGIRYQPSPSLAFRLGGGFSLTGFWFGLGGSVGVSKSNKKAAAATPKSGDVESEESYQ